MGENGRGTITTNLWFCGWRASERRTNAKKGGGWREKTKKKEREFVEREKGVKTSFLLVPRNIWAKVYILCLKYTLVIYYNSNSLATTRTHTHTFATNISLSLPLKTSTTTTVTITVRSKNTRADRTFSFPSTRSCARRVPTFLKIPPGSRRSAPLRRL